MYRSPESFGSWLVEEPDCVWVYSCLRTSVLLWKQKLFNMCLVGARVSESEGFWADVFGVGAFWGLRFQGPGFVFRFGALGVWVSEFQVL